MLEERGKLGADGGVGGEGRAVMQDEGEGEDEFIARVVGGSEADGVRENTVGAGQ